ncbi:MAG: PsiF family protein [Steroidobacteraceae bacterium]|jgi:hypothetical protein
MRHLNSLSTIALNIALAASAVGPAGLAFADDPTPPAAGADGATGPNGRHHNAAWAACKQKADDQKLERGDARREFMKDCLKSAGNSAPPPPST